METLWQDLRYGFRVLRASPGFAAVAVLSLALGIGANTSIFSVVNAALLRPLPVTEPDRLVFVFNGSRTNPWGVSSYPDYIDYRDKNEVFSDLLTYSGITMSARADDQTDLLSGSIVSGNFFDALGVRAALGRTFLPEEDLTPNTHPVAVIGHGLWERRFGSDPKIIGQQLALNGHAFTIIGVAPAGFNGLVFGSSGDFGPAPMTAVDVRTGNTVWQDRNFPKANFVYADGKVILLDEDGVLALVTLSPQGMKVISKTNLLTNLAWTPPTLAGTRLYVRDRKMIVALDLS